MDKNISKNKFISKIWTSKLNKTYIKILKINLSYFQRRSHPPHRIHPRRDLYLDCCVQHGAGPDAQARMHGIPQCIQDAPGGRNLQARPYSPARGNVRLHEE